MWFILFQKCYCMNSWNTHTLRNQPYASYVRNQHSSTALNHITVIPTDVLKFASINKIATKLDGNILLLVTPILLRGQATKNTGGHNAQKSLAWRPP